jgi:hypothetical protein
MKTNVNLKFKMGAALMVMGLGLAGAVNTVQAKDVVLKEIPKEFICKGGTWVNPKSTNFSPPYIDKKLVVYGDPQGVDVNLKSITKQDNGSIIVVVDYIGSTVTRDEAGDFIPVKDRAADERATSVLTLVGNKLTDTVTFKPVPGAKLKGAAVARNEVHKAIGLSCKRF